jgi:DNA-binding transcriptional ArsR family regulator
MPKRKPDIDRIFHALGDPTRRAILEQLSHGPVSVSRLAEPLNITLAAVVQHLQVLADSGLVQTEKTGRVRTCRLEPSGFAAARQWLDDRRSIWERGLDSLGALL